MALTNEIEWKKKDKHMQYYFIGGLGSTATIWLRLIDELGFPVTFLDPIGNDSDRKRFVLKFQRQISQTEETCLLAFLREI